MDTVTPVADVPLDERWVMDRSDLHLWSCQVSKELVLCWLGHLQHVVSAHCTLMPHQTALASFVLTSVDICGCDEAIMWQSLCCVPPPAQIPKELYPHFS